MRVIFFIISVMVLLMANLTFACRFSCPTEYKPVCAVSTHGPIYRTFTNGCEVGKYNCEHAEDEYTICFEDACFTDAQCPTNSGK